MRRLDLIKATAVRKWNFYGLGGAVVGAEEVAETGGTEVAGFTGIVFGA